LGTTRAELKRREREWGFQHSTKLNTKKGIEKERKPNSMLGTGEKGGGAISNKKDLGTLPYQGKG